ncbi:hypothetical protein [Streptomyces sp. NPDC058695]|uniref:hypothetical protein n=1 Tax=Streptomyces sp. NPDC058695 TaxID=3346604 RepID=UPI0036685A73
MFLGAQALWQNRHAAPATATHPGTTGARPTGSPWRTGLVSNVLNPKIAVSCTGLLPTPAPPQRPAALATTLLVLLRAALTLAWLGSYVFLLSNGERALEESRIRRALGRPTTGVVLIASRPRAPPSEF